MLVSSRLENQYDDGTGDSRFALDPLQLESFIGKVGGAIWHEIQDWLGDLPDHDTFYIVNPERGQHLQGIFSKGEERHLADNQYAARFSCAGDQGQRQQQAAGAFVEVCVLNMAQKLAFQSISDERIVDMVIVGASDHGNRFIAKAACGELENGSLLKLADLGQKCQEWLSCRKWRVVLALPEEFGQLCQCIPKGDRTADQALLKSFVGQPQQMMASGQLFDSSFKIVVQFHDAADAGAPQAAIFARDHGQDKSAEKIGARETSRGAQNWPGSQ